MRTSRRVRLASTVVLNTPSMHLIATLNTTHRGTRQEHCGEVAGTGAGGGEGGPQKRWLSCL